MKNFIYAFLLMPLFLVQAENQDYSKVELLISENFTELLKDDKSTKDAEEKKEALEIATNMQMGKCPDALDETKKPYIIKRLSANKLNAKQTETLLECIEKIGVKQEDDFTLMVDLLPFWEKENPFVELFYTTFFKGYKKPNTKTLGLLDNAKLMCATAAINFLEKEKYPANFEKTLSDKEYALFLEYVKDFRCYGYANER